MIVKKVLLSIISLLLLFTLSACGKEKIKEDDNKEDNKVIETVPDKANAATSNDEVSEVSDFKALYSDQTKMVFAYTDNSKIVFYHNGTQITGYELYYNYEDAATATLAKDTIKNDGTDDIKEVRVEGTMLVVVYTENTYRDLSLEDVRTVYSYLKEVTK